MQHIFNLLFFYLIIFYFNKNFNNKFKSSFGEVLSCKIRRKRESKFGRAKKLKWSD